MSIPIDSHLCSLSSIPHPLGIIIDLSPLTLPSHSWITVEGVAPRSFLFFLLCILSSIITRQARVPKRSVIPSFPHPLFLYVLRILVCLVCLCILSNPVRSSKRKDVAIMIFNDQQTTNQKKKITRLILAKCIAFLREAESGEGGLGQPTSKLPAIQYSIIQKVYVPSFLTGTCTACVPG